MTLVNLKTVLDKAYAGRYAVGAFNATDLNTARGIIQAAEELNSPIILQFAESHSEYISIETVANMYLDLAHNTHVPVCVHLDHGMSFEMIMKAVRLGFTSIMIDASALPFEENIARTKEIIKVAKPLNISVEAELGIMNEESDDIPIDGHPLEDTYTDPNQCRRFVEETGIDALAIAFGTAHGLYKSTPKLNFDLVKEVKSNIEVPLVMHGGSGLSTTEYQKAIDNGIAKINYYSTMSYEVTNGLRNYLNNTDDAYLFDIDQKTIELVKENIKEKIKVFSSHNKA